MATPKAIYSFNGPLMWFVLYLPVSSNVLLDSDEAELFISSSWSWYRHTITHLVPSSLMRTFSGCTVRNFLWRCLIMQPHMQTSNLFYIKSVLRHFFHSSPEPLTQYVCYLLLQFFTGHVYWCPATRNIFEPPSVFCGYVCKCKSSNGWWWHFMITWHELEAGWGELRRVGHTILPTSGQIKYAWRQGREREGESEKGRGKLESRMREMQGSVRQKSREESEAELKGTGTC